MGSSTMSNRDSTTPQPEKEPLSLMPTFYGRQLLFERAKKVITQTPGAHLLLLHGPKGVGKSTALLELGQTLAQTEHVMLQTTCEATPANTANPDMAPLISAANLLVQKLLELPPAQVAIVRKHLHTALGAAAATLGYWVSDLHLLTHIAPNQAITDSRQERTLLKAHLVTFFYTVVNHLNCLILCIDNLQWAPANMLDFLLNLAEVLRDKRFYFCATLSEKPPDDDSFLSHFLDSIQARHIACSHMAVELLDILNVQQLVLENFDCSLVESTSLATYLFEQTHGNPQQIENLLVDLYAQNLLSFDNTSGQWRWQNMNHAELLTPENHEVDLLIAKLDHLTPTECELLSIAAALSNQVLANTLQHFMSQAHDVSPALEQFVKYGLLIKTHTDPATYTFVHPRLRLAACHMLQATTRQRIYALIDKQLHTTKNLREDNTELFSWLGQLHIDLQRSTTSDENRLELAALHQLASERAQAAPTHEQALQLSMSGIDLLVDGAWSSHPQLCYQLHLLAGQSAQAFGKFSQAITIYQQLVDKSLQPEEQALGYGKLASLHLGNQDIAQALQLVQKGLQLLGLVLPPDISRWKMLGMQLALNYTPYLQSHRLQKLGPTTAQMLDTLLEILLQISYGNHAEWFVWGCFTLLQKAYQQGNTHATVLAYASQTVLQDCAGRIDWINEDLSQVNISIADTWQIPQTSAWVRYFIGVGQVVWHKSIDQALNILQECVRIYPHQASPVLAQSAYTALCMLRWFAGHDLDAILAQSTDISPPSDEIKDLYASTTSRSLIFFIDCLQSRAELSHAPKSLPGWSCVLSMQLHYLLGDFNKAYQLSTQITAPSPIFNQLDIAEHAFLQALICAKLYDNAKFKDKWSLRQKINQAYRRLKKWSTGCGENFESRYWLVAAERARIRGFAHQAEVLYDKVIEQALNTGFKHLVAMAYECAGHHYKQQNRHRVAYTYLSQACSFYQQWGALRKSTELENTLKHHTTHTKSYQVSTESLLNRQTDNQSVFIEALQSMSEVIKIEELYIKVMRIFLEISFTKQACFLIQQDNQWFIEAFIDTNTEQVQQEELLVSTQKVAIAVVHHVASTLQIVILRNPYLHGPFVPNAYIQQHKPTLIVCFPLLRQGALSGVLYLENRDTQESLLPSRIEGLSMLANQAQISLENARLYDSLEKEVIKHTQKLQDSQERLLQAEKQNTEKRMAGGFAHEVRNILGSVKLALATALGHAQEAPHTSLALATAQLTGPLFEAVQDTLPKSQQPTVIRLLRNIISNSERLDELLHLAYDSNARGLNITQQIMEYARLGEMQPGDTPIVVADLLQAAVQEFSMFAQKNAIDVSLKLQHPHIKIICRQEHLYSVFKNIIQNAGDALLDKVPNESCQIAITDSLEGSTYTVHITDNGCGIPEESLGKIFETFFSTKPQTGTGLGLGLVEKILSLYGAQIHVVSQVQKGSTFSLKFLQHLK